MRLFVVKKVTFFKGSPHIRSIHYDLFHGVCFRSADSEGGESPRLGENYSPLSIIRTAFLFPTVTMPSLNLVVTAPVAESLRVLPQLQLAEVQIEKLVDCYYEKGDFSHYRGGKGPPPSDSAKYLSELPAIIPSPPSPQMFEVITAENQDLVSNFDGAKQYVIGMGPQAHDDEFDFVISRTMLEEYPLHTSSPLHLMSEEVFGMLEPYLDPDFFIIKSIEI